VRTVVFGNRELACVCLEELLGLEVEVPLVVTSPRDPAGHPGYRCLAEVAREHGIAVATPPDATGRSMLDWVRGIRPDIVFSFHYDHRIPRTIRGVPRLGAYNLHESLLPRWRGPCPIPFVILHGERESGVSLHEMVEEFDAGDVVAQVRFPVGPRETATTLFRKALAAARVCLRRSVPVLLEERAPHAPQDGAGATVTPSIARHRAVNRAASVERFDRTVRAFTHPYPGARVPFGGEIVVVWAGEPGEGADGIPLPLADGTYRVLRLGFEGEPATDWREFLSRFPDAPEHLGVPRPAFKGSTASFRAEEE